MPSADVVFSVVLVLSVPTGGEIITGMVVVVVVDCDVEICAPAIPDIIASAAALTKSIFFILRSPESALRQFRVPYLKNDIRTV